MKKSLLFTILAVLLIAIVGFFLFKPTQTGDVINNFENQTPVNITFFYGQGCPHCAKLEVFLNDLEKKYPLNIVKYEVYSNKTNIKIFEQTMTDYNSTIQGVPTIIINNKVIVGFSNDIGTIIEKEVQECYQICNKIFNETSYIKTDSSPAEDPKETEFKKKLTIPAVISAALVDSINPCEFAILILLLTTILASGNKKRALLAGLAFSLSIYISYFLMGLGLYSAIASVHITRIFYYIVAGLAIILGLFNLKDYFWYGKFFIMEVPLTWRPRMKLIVKSVTSVWGAFLIGFVISLFLLPCTSGPYIVILGLLAETATKGYAISLLLLYNLIFILPMLILTAIIASGLASTEKIELWRMKNLKLFHLIAGTILILLGIFMIVSVWIGWI